MLWYFDFPPKLEVPKLPELIKAAITVAYNDKGEYDRAISDYTNAIEINTRFAAAYYNRGLAYSPDCYQAR